MKFFQNLKFNWKFSKNNKKNLIWIITLGILSVIISVVVPVLSSKIIVNLTNSEFERLILICVILFLVEGGRNIIRYFIRLNNNILFRETYINLQTELGKKILALETRVIDDTGSGVFIQRLTNDTSRISDIFPLLVDYLIGIISKIGIYIAILIINKFVFIYMMVFLIIYYLIESKRVKLRNENDRKFRKSNEKVSSFVGEIVRGLRDIKMLNSEKCFSDELHTKVRKLNNERYNINKVDRNYNLLSGFAYDLSDFFLIILLIFMLKNSFLSITNALIIHNYSGRVTSMVSVFGTLLERIKDYNLSVERIKEIMNGETYTKESFGDVHLDKVNGDFEFKNVSFSYDKKKVLDNISFKIKANQTVAFVGKSGVGKSTIFNLLCKFYEVDSGEIMIDGVNIKNLDKDSIRGNITVINQSPYIFNVSIKDNLKLVKPDLTDREIKRACKLACLHDFIMSLPDKYDTIIGEGGVNLSGGQKQRLAIARALVQKTEIILFDEATSALDNETQKNIQNAINNMKGEYTILIIAHRFSTILNSDKIMYIDEGKVKAEGTHLELLKKSKDYKLLYESEFK